jgi:hypothetical protein
MREHIYLGFLDVVIEMIVLLPVGKVGGGETFSNC